MEYTMIARKSSGGYLIGCLKEFPEVLAQGKDLFDLKLNLSDALDPLLRLRRRVYTPPVELRDMEFEEVEEEDEFINI